MSDLCLSCRRPVAENQLKYGFKICFKCSRACHDTFLVNHFMSGGTIQSLLSIGQTQLPLQFTPVASLARQINLTEEDWRRVRGVYSPDKIKFITEEAANEIMAILNAGLCK